MKDMTLLELFDYIDVLQAIHQQYIDSLTEYESGEFRLLVKEAENG